MKHNKLSRAATELSKAASAARRKNRKARRPLDAATRRASKNTLVILDGKYLICSPDAAWLAALCDLRVDYTADRYLRGLPCSPIEELIGRRVVAGNRLIRSDEENRLLGEACRITVQQLEQLRSRWPWEPMRKWSPDARKPRGKVSVTGETHLPITREDAESGDEDVEPVEDEAKTGG